MGHILLNSFSGHLTVWDNKRPPAVAALKETARDTLAVSSLLTESHILKLCAHGPDLCTGTQADGLLAG